MLKQTKFKIDIYDVVVKIIVAKTPTDVNEQVKKLCKKHKDLHNDDTPYAGYTITFDNKTYYLLLSEDSLSYNLITHETDHLRTFILKHISVSLNEIDEYSANLNGYINQKVFNFLIKHNYKIK